MLVDENSSVPGIVEVDICIIGAGPAGITFAREYAGSSVRVALLESGKFDFDSRAQELADGEVDSYYFDKNAIAEGRRRQFGGTSNSWIYTTAPSNQRLYARCLPPEEIDLAPVEGHSESDWPLTLHELTPFLRRAQSVWNGAPFDYDPGTWANESTQPIGTDSHRLITRICQHGPADVFYLRYRDDLLSAPNIDVYLDCTAVELAQDGSAGRARSLRVARSNGETFSVQSKVYILACGGVENVQLLLLSDLTQSGGVGNQFDNIGRYVTSHPEFRMGTVVPERREIFDEMGLYDLRWVGQHMITAFLTLSEETKRSNALLNMSVGLLPRRRGFGTESHRAIAALAAAARRREKPTETAAHLLQILRSPGGALATVSQARSRYFEEWRGGWSRHDFDRAQFEVIELWAAPEHSAERQNRITLVDKTDWLGRKQVKLDFGWSRDDRENISRSVDLISTELESAGLGRASTWAEFEGSGRVRQPGLHHPMGGTRMHVDPRHGAVDENCRVHGLSNVYVAGSSVFTTGLGYANPTLTLLALTLRLADHVKAEFPT